MARAGVGGALFFWEKVAKNFWVGVMVSLFVIRIAGVLGGIRGDFQRVGFRFKWLSISAVAYSWMALVWLSALSVGV